MLELIKSNSYFLVIGILTGTQKDFLLKLFSMSFQSITEGFFIQFFLVKFEKLWGRVPCFSCDLLFGTCKAAATATSE